MSYPVLSCSILFHPALYCSFPILSCSILFYRVLFCSILFYSVLSCYIIFYPVLSYSILLYIVLFLFFSCPILFYRVLLHLFVNSLVSSLYNESSLSLGYFSSKTSGEFSLIHKLNKEYKR